jgi:hypothetical protein
MNAKRTIAVSASFFLVFIFGQNTKAAVAQPTSSAEVRFCDLIAENSKYLGVSVNVRARITYLKEGTSLWDPNCPNLGALLSVKPSDEADQSINELYGRLKRVGLSSHPITAVLIGELKIERPSSPQRPDRLAFFALRATDISQTIHSERRHFQP